MSENNMDKDQLSKPRLASTIRRFSLLIILGWVAITVLVTLAVPPLEVVERDHSVSLSPPDAPSVKAMTRMGELFQESNSESVAVIVLEGQEPLGAAAHTYYDQLVRQLKNDPEHIQHVQDFWGDPLTAGAAQSADGKAAYVQLNLHGSFGQAAANESVQAVQDVVKRTEAPPGIQTYVTGPAAIVADMGQSGNRTVILITLVSVGVIFLMLLLLYRSFITVIILLFTVGIELQVARGVVAFLGLHGLVGLTTYVVNLLVSVGIAAGTDYAIFFTGRYQEARQAGEDREKAYYTAYRSVAKVVLASGVTIAGAIACLSFTRLPYFQPLGIPGAVGILIAVAVALTLVPACIAAGSRVGIFDPKRPVTTRRWRRIGTAIVRWPAPILLATLAVALIGLLTLPGYSPSYSDQKYIPQDIPANQGFAAASRHFPESKMTTPDLLLVEADHDMRNPTDLLVLNKLAKAVFAVPGIANVQSITRPEGTQIEHSSIPFMLSMSNASQRLALPFQKARMEDLVKQADDMSNTISLMQRMYDLMQLMVGTTHRMVGTTHDLQADMGELRDHMADFEDFWRPLRNYLYWEPHCFDIPMCWSIRSVFDALDGIDEVTTKMQGLVKELDQLDLLMPQMLLQFPQMIATMQSTRTMMLTMHSTMSGIFSQMDESGDNATAMGKAFDASNNDDSFYLPPDALENKDFQRIMKIFLAPDGKAARMLITQRSDPATPEGISRVEPLRIAAEEALKGTPLESSKLYLAGTAAGVKDLVDGSKIDLLIAGVTALALIFLIMVLMTRSFVAALVIVGTVALSLGASFGLSVLVWQYILGMQINWVVLAMSVIVLLAVGSDYNLLLVSRMKEELHAGINTGIIRAMGGTGKVVTAAGLVFAATMASMIVSDLLTIGQVGTTIGLGLLFDTLIVRAFMTPSIAALLGRWFWWPQQVRPRPASSMLRPMGPRPLVRSLLLRD
ncbi:MULTISPECIES: RND family transporter [unclassified Mycolicibacterium]|uniref:MMPL/RND family transporter n=1 Tax=unclassified Mycolicibacterium TaxID=2636767 RepID=UPI0012DD15D9|nr:MULTISPECIES: RND family transporter [unclassified Mycolicibacterium]MUL82892.1 RND family transporter [Mycolicibacterium sp. CBMA 329]MUL89227.1 RND family transporter [Mycolicibacterium sp. CBMA 331]MUL97794.1 RND family transporter [Mycolicibacterium sp. CBMA 334]MUM25295.1 RND family transporter [Mycolicibacterium sp. CBMA 295]MUM38743.1 RND family transporter [Mycolicibacterium sp. CBMA 247]